MPYVAQAGLAEVYRGFYPGCWAAELARPRGVRGWAAPAARRLIALLREDDVLPLCRDAQLDADDAVDPALPHYLAAIPLDGEQHYGALLSQAGAAVRDAPSYILLEWLIADRGMTGPLDRAEARAWAGQYGGTLADRTYAMIERADALWEEWSEDAADSPADLLLFDLGGHCGRRDDGLRWLPTLVACRQQYQRVCEGEVDDLDNPFLTWSDGEWAGYEEAGHLVWSLEHVGALAEYWEQARAIQDEVQATWAALAAPEAMERLVPLLAAVFAADGSPGA